MLNKSWFLQGTKGVWGCPAMRILLRVATMKSS